ncbi:hypothetical protein LTS07_001779 [Exophiala sideris]|uniref:Zn(2)-C6 fungal-type domain-containing protein n=1 Tax=Exophiala sideris TaxID=1016849 RepID=A0ABR0JPF3_9EURO|nr:hypothetical protein LTS07_001779 [Exophiala sideris]KAK5044293.1 hypothetical protein LTR13_000649 [Exophiala sideris]KAK5067793.1 hypothetical protein LTR69_001782 [Exophiala sideris]KAK5183967.1 hypothetical protein LTR44_003472 [Eurotiomycetes sp. CCFEE 6388]
MLGHPEGDAADRLPAKRMRLGTKSCAECRRRRVRCHFPTNDSRVCEACNLHNIPCIPQTKKHHDDQEKIVLKRRVGDLEETVRQITGALDVMTRAPNVNQSPVEQSQDLRKQLPNITEYVSVTSTDRPAPSDLETPDEDSDWNEDEQAPLMSLLQETLNISEPRGLSNHSQVGKPDNPHVKACLSNLSPLLPSLGALTSVLRATQEFWPLWPYSPISQAGNNGNLDDIDTAKAFIVNSLNSGTPCITAKALLWLALCIQQLPRGFRPEGDMLPDSLSSLLKHYMHNADHLLSTITETSGNSDFIECLLQQFKLYFNMGKPRKAWLSNRRAMNTALLLGFQNVDGSTPESHKALWSKIWVTDRQLSVILGLPAAIDNSHPSVSAVQGKAPLEEQLFRELATISGLIIQRNQNHTNATYAMTMEIDDLLEQFKAKMPPEWWDPAPGLPLAVTYSRQHIKLAYYSLCKIVHLPYMLKSAKERKYEISRISALEASRDLIKTHRMMRHQMGPESIMICDVLDFLAFSAAIIIVIDLLSMPTTRHPRDEAEDWVLVQGVTKDLRNVSEVLNCDVSGQAAQVLEWLSQARNGTWSGTRTCTIPYFGRVTIGRPTRDDEMPFNGTRLQASEMQRPAGSVEISTNTSTSFSQFSDQEWLSDQELNMDWTSFSDMNENYDWSMLFSTPIPE